MGQYSLSARSKLTLENFLIQKYFEWNESYGNWPNQLAKASVRAELGFMLRSRVTMVKY